MKIENYIKRFERIALAKEFKNGARFATNLLDGPTPDLIIFNTMDPIFFSVLARTPSIKESNYYVLNCKYLGKLPLSLPAGHSPLVGGEVYSFDWFVVDEKEQGHLIKALVICACFESIVDEFLIPNGVLLETIVWQNYGGYDREEQDATIRALKELQIRYFLELQGPDSVSAIYKHNFVEINSFANGQEYDRKPGILWGVR